jgi:perosamine synthetase
MYRFPLTKTTYCKADRKVLQRLVKQPVIENGEKVSEFENTFAKFIGVKNGITTNSGTSALHVALLALGVKPHSEVIFPSYTCVALLNAVTYLNAKPVLVDNYFNVKENNFNISVEEVKKRISRKTKAIIVPHMFGTPADIVRLRKLGISIIEDATHSLGARVAGKQVGSLGDIGVFSFHYSKMISTGQGGIALTNSQRYYSKMRQLNNYDDEVVKMRFAAEKELSKYDYEASFSYKMTDMQAALGLSQLKNLDRFILRRFEIALMYDDILNSANIEKPHIHAAYEKQVFFRYIIQISKDVEPVARKLLSKGIEIGRGVYPLLHYFTKDPKERFPNAEKCIRTLISVPIYPSLTDADARFIATEVKKVVDAQ